MTPSQGAFFLPSSGLRSRTILWNFFPLRTEYAMKAVDDVRTH